MTPLRDIDEDALRALQREEPRVIGDHVTVSAACRLELLRLAKITNGHVSLTPSGKAWRAPAEGWAG